MKNEQITIEDYFELDDDSEIEKMNALIQEDVPKNNIIKSNENVNSYH